MRESQDKDDALPVPHLPGAHPPADPHAPPEPTAGATRPPPPQTLGVPQSRPHGPRAPGAPRLGPPWPRLPPGLRTPATASPHALAPPPHNSGRVEEDSDATAWGQEQGIRTRYGRGGAASSRYEDSLNGASSHSEAQSAAQPLALTGPLRAPAPVGHHPAPPARSGLELPASRLAAERRGGGK